MIDDGSKHTGIQEEYSMCIEFGEVLYEDINVKLVITENLKGDSGFEWKLEKNNEGSEDKKFQYQLKYLLNPLLLKIQLISNRIKEANMLPPKDRKHLAVTRGAFFILNQVKIKSIPYFLINFI